MFITTSTFTKEAKEAAVKASGQVVLIDGDRLGELMIDYDVGVSSVNKYEIKKLDTDYFEN